MQSKPYSRKLFILKREIDWLSIGSIKGSLGICLFFGMRIYFILFGYSIVEELWYREDESFEFTWSESQFCDRFRERAERFISGTFDYPRMSNSRVSSGGG